MERFAMPASDDTILRHLKRGEPPRVSRLQATGENFPQLKRVIAVSGDKVVMEPTLDEAMAVLFVKQQPMAVFDNGAPAPAGPAQ